MPTNSISSFVITRLLLLALVMLACTASASAAAVARHRSDETFGSVPIALSDSKEVVDAQKITGDKKDQEDAEPLSTSDSIGDRVHDLLYSEKNSASGWRALSEHALNERDLDSRAARSLTTFPFPLPCRTSSLRDGQPPEVEGLR